MKIALLGYGKMGHEIEAIALKRGHTISLKITEENLLENNLDHLVLSDVAIDFSTPKSVLNHISTCFNIQIPLVVGTTGWNTHEPEIKKMCLQKNATLFYASNFSVGVNIFFEINKRLAQLMGSQTQYDVDIEEIHHTQKLDAPSGTAISLANDILENNSHKKTWKLDKTEQENDLLIKAIRKENVPGTHTVTYNSANDFIKITHEAKNRKGFAFGAVLAAEFIKEKKGIFGMNDILNF